MTNGEKLQETIDRAAVKFEQLPEWMKAAIRNKPKGQIRTVRPECPLSVTNL
jgi:hypothetical protein